MSQSHSNSNKNNSRSIFGGRGTNNSNNNDNLDHDDPWQTAAQVAATREHPEPSIWSERPPWLSSKQQQQQQQQSHPPWNPNDVSQAANATMNASDGNRQGSCTTDSCCCCCTRQIVPTWHVLDGILGIAWLMYALFLCQTRHHQGNDPEWSITTGWYMVTIITWFIAALLFLRSVMGGMAMTLAWWDRCGLRYSAMSSILLGLIFMIASAYGFFGKDELLNWMALHHHTVLVPKDVLHFVQHTPAILWIIPVLACLVELLRWFCVQRYYRLLQQEDNTITIARPRRTKRPWWWQSNRAVSGNTNEQDFMDPLLNNNNNAPRQSNSGGGWFSFGKWFGGSGDGANGGRDDGSVEYASLSEDWASRSEEDPLWWSREEEMKTPKRSTTTTTTTAGEE